MQKTRFFGRLLACGMFCASVKTAQAVEIGALLGPTLSTPSVTSTADTSAKSKPHFAYEGGVYLELGAVPPLLGVETGAYFARRALAIEAGTGGAATTSTFTSLHVPLLLRAHLPFLFSFGVGPFLDYSFGQVTSLTGATSSFTAAGLKTLGYGLVADARFTRAIVPLVSFVADLRFKLGLSNLSSTDAMVIRARETEVLVGVSVGI